jgi:hypothetical protein
VFCVEQERVVGRDYVVQYAGQALQLAPHARFRLSPKSRVVVRETADGVLRVLQREAHGGEHEIRWQPAPPRLPKPTPPASPPRPRPVPRPAADHPWRRQIAQEVADRRAQQARVAAGHP